MFIVLQGILNSANFAENFYETMKHFITDTTMKKKASPRAEAPTSCREIIQHKGTSLPRAETLTSCRKMNLTDFFNHYIF